MSDPDTPSVPDPPEVSVQMPQAPRPGSQSSQPSASHYEVELPYAEELQALLGGGYIVESFLGQGGMGAVYRGLQLPLRRPVAIKILRRKTEVDDFGFEERFKREAYAMAALTHPHIVQVYDCGDAGENFLFISMELVEGGDLSDAIKKGQITPEAALKLIPQICDGLQAAHEHGIVHRDIKPANIFLTTDGRAKVADFGLAKKFDTQSTFATKTGLGMGTPDYAAPEQYEGLADIDHRADIYALGVMMYQMLTGSLPRGNYKPPSQRVAVDTRIDAVVGKATEPDRNERYQSAEQLKTDLTHIISGKARTVAVPGAPRAAGPTRAVSQPAARPTAAPAQRQTQSVLPAKKSSAGKLVGVLGLVVVIGVGAFLVLKRSQPKAATGPVSVSTESFIAEVAKLPPDQQIIRVAEKLRELNPGFDGKIAHKIEGGKVASLTFGTTKVTDISPVAALKSLQRLAFDCQKEKGILVNLAPLRGLKLTTFFSSGNLVSDITPLKGMPMTSFTCVGGPLEDLSPLMGMALTEFACNNTKVSDLWPLAGMPLKSFNCNGSRVQSFKPLKGMPLEYVNSEQCKVSDLSPLKGAPITMFYGGLMSYSDLSPLAGAPLKFLNIYATGVTDLSPLKGMPLQNLGCARTKIQDFSPLAGLPLQSISCDFKPERDLALFRSIKTLKTINGKPAAETLSASQ